jgi:membrane-bound metal-dependent hydrolase YbcI (DUF457 family)
MCLGHTHALAGLAAGLAAGEFALHLPPVHLLELAGFTACYAVLPDLDQVGSCAARSLGFLSEGFAWLVHKLTGGHRHGTHSLAAIGVFTLLTWLACDLRHVITPWPLAVLLALALAAGLRALRLGGHAADLLALAGAAAIARYGYGLPLVPLGCALGVACHIAADALTTEGVPLWLPFSPAHAWLSPRPLRFETGHAAESAIVAPALLLALGYLAWHGAGMVHG